MFKINYININNLNEFINSTYFEDAGQMHKYINIIKECGIENMDTFWYYHSHRVSASTGDINMYMTSVNDKIEETLRHIQNRLNFKNG